MTACTNSVRIPGKREDFAGMSRVIMAKKKKLIIVSNRLPISVSKVDGKLVFKPSSGGLAGPMSTLQKNNSQILWIGWPLICAEDVTKKERSKITRKLKDSGCFPIFLTRKQVKKYYDGYSNDTIWPLFHYFQTLVQHHPSYWKGYEEVNDIFAKTVEDHADKKATIWVHDYHLMLLPKMIRARMPESMIGFFLHIPFPSYEIFRLLPDRTKILNGLLGADLIGFHIYDYARHFLSSLLRVRGLENNNGIITVGNRVVKVDAFPIGIDYEKFASAEQNKQTAKELKAITGHYKGKKIILSMDRLDYSKGILRRLDAFDQFLRKYPKYLQKVVLVMVAVPSRTEVSTYKNLKKEIEETISKINGRYSTVDWSPISYQFRHLPFEQVSALLIRADVALLTPLRDGMNLVAKEYIAVKQGRPGVLILSEMTGAIDELPEAISVNPNDLDSIKDAIHTALEMPKAKQLQNIRIMQKRLSLYTVERWSQDFIEQLEKSRRLQQVQRSKLIDKHKEQKILRSFKKAKRKLIILDYDGTVTDFVSTHDPKRSEPSQELLSLLGEISKVPGMLLCVVSGRPKKVLESWFGKLPIALSAEHGAWVKNDNEWSREQVSLGKYRKNIIDLLKQYADRTPGASIEEKDFSIVWHYRTVPSELAQARTSSLEYELKGLLANSDFAVFRGAKILEIRPSRINKGVIAEDFLALHQPDFVMCIGDDNTDEDMFQVMPDDAFSIKVGLGETNARFQIIEVGSVLKFLKKFS